MPQKSRPSNPIFEFAGIFSANNYSAGQFIQPLLPNFGTAHNQAVALSDMLDNKAKYSGRPSMISQSRTLVRCGCWPTTPKHVPPASQFVATHRFTDRNTDNPTQETGDEDVQAYPARIRRLSRRPDGSTRRRFTDQQTP